MVYKYLIFKFSYPPPNIHIKMSLHYVEWYSLAYLPRSNHYLYHSQDRAYINLKYICTLLLLSILDWIITNNAFLLINNFICEKYICIYSYKNRNVLNVCIVLFFLHALFITIKAWIKDHTIIFSKQSVILCIICFLIGMHQCKTSKILPPGWMST